MAGPNFRPKIRLALDRIAIYALGAIKKRAFRTGETAENVEGQSAPDLTSKYADAKAAQVVYKDDASRARAMLRRQQNAVGGGRGMVVLTEGGKQRLGARPPVADQVLSGGTQKALQITESSETRRVIGFNTERARRIAQALEIRNGVTVGLSSEERAKVVRIAEQTLKLGPGEVKFRRSTVRLVI